MFLKIFLAAITVCSLLGCLGANRRDNKRIAAVVAIVALMLKDPNALQGKRWNSSKNLRKPTILRKEPIKDKGWYNKIARLPKKLEKSYYLDGDSVREGIHEKTGYTFFTYTFVRINQTWKETELEWEKL